MFDLKTMLNEHRKELNIKDRLLSYLIYLSPPPYAASSIKDFLENRKKIKNTANFFQAYLTADFPYGCALIWLPETRYEGINSEGIVRLEDMTSSLNCYPTNESRLCQELTQSNINPGQSVNAFLFYKPKNDAAWVWHLSQIEDPAVNSSYGLEKMVSLGLVPA